jgi:hypothetical protein
MLFLLIHHILAACLSTQLSSICSPLTNYFIDSVRLARFYSIPELTVEKWEQRIAMSSSGGEIQSQIWNQLYYCPNYNGELIQYHRSFVCSRDIFVLSEECNNKLPKVHLCPFVCQQYQTAVSTLLQNQELCSPTNRNPVGHICNPHPKPFNECISGIDSDESSCGNVNSLGFAGNTSIAREYCKRHPNEECCSKIPSHSNHQALQFFPDRVMRPQRPKIQKPQHVFSNGYIHAFTIGSIILVMLLCVFGSAYAIAQYQSNEPRPIYLRHPSSFDFDRFPKARRDMLE